MSQFPPDYPIEYIEWRVRFFGRDFIITPDVLIPRLETESLVRKARKILQHSNTPTLQHSIVVDIGCGSGIIGTSVADLADEVIFLDISPAALVIAELNFRTHFPEKKARFIVSDLLSNLLEKGGVTNEMSDGGLVLENIDTPIPLSQSDIPISQGGRVLFLTNLPYIKADDWEHMSPDTRHEPQLALFGGESTGFELYERLFDQLSALAPLIRGGGGFARWRCLFEFWFDQREIAENHLKTKYPQWEYSFFADYAGVERFGEVLLISKLYI